MFAPPADCLESNSLERMWVAGGWDFGSSGERLKIGDSVSCFNQVQDVKEATGKDGRRGIYVTQSRKVGVVAESGPDAEGFLPASSNGVRIFIVHLCLPNSSRLRP